MIGFKISDLVLLLHSEGSHFDQLDLLIVLVKPSILHRTMLESCRVGALHVWVSTCRASHMVHLAHLLLPEALVGYQIKNGNYFSGITFELVIQFLIVFVDVLCVHVEHSDFCFSNLVELLDVVRLLEIVIIVDIRVKGEIADEIADFVLYFVGVDVSAPEDLRELGIFIVHR